MARRRVQNRGARFQRHFLWGGLTLALAALGVAGWTLTTPWAAGETAAPAPTEDKQALPSDDTKLLVTHITAFHQLASADLELAIKNFKTASSFDFLVQSKSYKESPLAWAWFFTTATVLLGNQDSAEQAVAFYNPFLDAAVLTRWKLDEAGRPYVLAATLRSGEEFESGRLATQGSVPRWMRSEQPPHQAMADQYRQFSAAFTRIFPPGRQTSWDAYASISPATRSLLDALAERALTDLYVLQNGPDKALNGLVRTVRKAIAEGGGGTLANLLPADNPLPPAAIAGLPESFRQNLVPVYSLWSERGVLVWMSSPGLLRFYVVAHYDTGPATKLRSLGCFDFAGD